MIKRSLALSCIVATVSLSRPVSAQSVGRGSAEGTIQGRKVRVDYGRPELKGRSLDALIAQLTDDRVWRAGADEVTTLMTEGDLMLNSLCGSSCSRVRRPGASRRVPAGKYSVYISAPEEGDWSLILNSDPGIELGALAQALGFSVPESSSRRLWPHLEGYNMNRAKAVAGIAGTEVARVVMRPGAAELPVDPLTMRLDPSDPNALTLTLAWADRAWSVDLHGAP